MSKVLVACEESQVVTTAFRKLGFEAYSCDIQECSGGHPEWHINDDVNKYIHYNWDILIAHPPCTYLSKAGSNRLFSKKDGINVERYKKGLEAKNFFMALYESKAKRICVENPIPLKIYGLPQYSQIIQPYYFGDPWIKTTCLWLKNLPILMCTDLVIPKGKWIYAKKTEDEYIGVRSAKDRSRTFFGVGAAMASQWGIYL